MIKTYSSLTKPGIIMGNAITAIGGFFLASKGFSLSLLILTLAGLSLIIASACVFNNYMDRDMDKLMARTKNRVLAQDLIPKKNAILFAIALGLVGTLILALSTNLLTVIVALSGFIIYVLIYSPLKYKSTYGTLIGSIAGGAPPLVGYFGAGGHFDMGAILLGLSVILWQMPHFYAIALYRLHDYRAASIPVLPLVKGIYKTKQQMLIYTVAFLIVTISLTFFGYTGYLYLSVMAVLDIAWIWLSFKGFTCSNDTVWARRMFIFSLIIIMLFCALIAINSIFIL